MIEVLINYWWVAIPLLAVVFYKFTLRVFFGMVIVPDGKIGVVTKKFVLFGSNKSLPDGTIIALNGEAGYQADTLAPGYLGWGYWPWQYSVEFDDFIVVPKGKIGLVSANDGRQLPADKGTPSNAVITPIIPSLILVISVIATLNNLGLIRYTPLFK